MIWILLLGLLCCFSPVDLFRSEQKNYEESLFLKREGLITALLMDALMRSVYDSDTETESIFSFLSYWLASTPVASQPISWCCGWERTLFVDLIVPKLTFLLFSVQGKHRCSELKSQMIMKRVRVSVISCLSSSYLLWSFHHLLWALNIPNPGIQDHWYRSYYKPLSDKLDYLLTNMGSR